jgi:hypothetical protein
MELVVWLLWIVAESRWNYFLIDKKKRYIRHMLMFTPRLAAGVLQLWWMLELGYIWYWAGSYIVFTHALFFPELLNAFRDKRVGYLGDPDPDAPGKSWYDKVIQALGHAELPWLVIRIILAISAIGITMVYGDRVFSAIP